MHSIEIDGRLQVTAGVSLLECSRLIECNLTSGRFEPVAYEVFEYAWRKAVDPVFGRLACWIMFSAGAEMLAKGVCLARKIELRSEKRVPDYPHGGIEAWSAGYFKNRGADQGISATDYGTLANLISGGKKGLDPAFSRLFGIVHAKASDRTLLLVAYDFLRTTIRNRDAHAYVPNVRDDHFGLVKSLFLPPFDLLVSWLPGGRPQLVAWRSQAREFIQSL
jgi:hypothetical protein